MITLTTPHDVNSILGGDAPVPYNKLVLGPFTMDPVQQTITGQMRLTATSNPSMQPIIGNLRINVATSEVVLDVQQLDFYRRISTNGVQNTAILNIIEAAQAQLESGLIALSLISGIRSVGV